VPPTIRIRDADPGDLQLMFSMIVELAEYERSADEVVGNPELLGEALFGPRPYAEAVIAELDGDPVGYALFHYTFSTWECRPGIWLEDLYVPPRHRRSGVGQALLAHIAGVAVERRCPRLEWTALDWNTPALEFYARLGARRMSEWLVHRLEGESLARVAEKLGEGSYGPG
jgi:GNAT superfamily N-acetyltransferase